MAATHRHVAAVCKHIAAVNYHLVEGDILSVALCRATVERPG